MNFYISKNKCWDYLVLIFSVLIIVGFILIATIRISELTLYDQTIQTQDIFSANGTIGYNLVEMDAYISNEKNTLAIYILSAILVLTGFLLSRFYPKKVGLFCVFFAIYHIDELVRLIAHIQYSCHGTGAAIMFLGGANSYTNNLNVLFLFLIFFTPLLLFLKGVILIVSTKKTRSSSEHKGLNSKKELVDQTIAFIPFYGIYTFSLVGMFGSAFLFTLPIIGKFDPLGIYLSYIFVTSGIFLILSQLQSKIKEPLIAKSRKIRIVSLSIASIFFIVITLFSIFLWGDLLFHSLLVSRLLKSSFNLDISSISSEFLAGFILVLLLFIIPLITSSSLRFLIYKLKMRKKTDRTEEEDKIVKEVDKIVPVKYNKKVKIEQVISFILITLILGLPGNLIIQGEEVCDGWTVNNFDTADAFGMNWSSNSSIMIKEVELYENSTFVMEINFQYIYHNVPDFIRADIIMVDSIVIDSDNNLLFDSFRLFSYIKIIAEEPQLEYSISNKSQGYSFVLYKSGNYQIKGFLNTSFIVDSAINFVLTYYNDNADPEYFLVQTNLMKTIIIS
ncbi:MAG: hypothetical protein ACTSQ4_01360 [Candidatus Heimdallarchaeaceae archaeon]